MEWITLILTVCIVIISFRLLFGKRSHPNAPPCIRGWIPWFGAAFEFGKAPLHFIQQARAKYGPVFTVVAAGKRLTFVTLNEDFRAFFTSKDVDFEQAVQEAVHNTASISKDCFYKTHPTCATVIKGRLTPGNTAMLSVHLCEEFNDHLENLGSEGSGQLNEIIKSVMYPAVMSNLLGRCNSPNNALTRQEFLEKFTTYDEGFEYGSQLPDMFLKQWANSKQWLLSLLRNMAIRSQETLYNENDGKTLLQHLATAISDKYLPNYGLLLLWASLANAIPITFWAIAFILANPEAYKIAMDQINAALRDQDKEKTKVTLDDLQHMPYVKWCIMEAIRLRAPGAITRKVVRPLKLQNYVIPPGDLLMLSPYWAHRNPKYFPDPEDFKPERWEKADLEKNVHLEGFVAFGGGKNQCPGSFTELCTNNTIELVALFMKSVQRCLGFQTMHI
ncbi:24-hydroxycholesterol 7-alpha-hydroxylase isoform X2 [Sinocyclocheilus anshuiensis]|uniref:24-hydroxycholesterol 7-alpha-hydroxylase isoform X2 n=1 Tax=Sinocyclocheilus anshuiensis TaxID=1608454 RepID=UPI0007B7FF80|nr:PREDICTED: 24-hydroxycholesterol 7-alpha-hydroxylase-like isoform X2 [Sinocyclocheilus anshuiensis]